nr:hypothetical protein [Oceanispirochaeta sp. M2]
MDLTLSWFLISSSVSYQKFDRPQSTDRSHTPSPAVQGASATPSSTASRTSRTVI